MVEVIRTLSPAKKSAFWGSVILLLIVFIAGVTWLMIPSYSNLFTGLDENTAAEAISRLEEKQIPFKVFQTSDGRGISVPSEQVEELKVTMAAGLGLPETKGLELFDNADYSMTDFSQDITYKRAIQGELSRTISSMPGVKSARVHITFAPKRLFSADQQKAKAAIFIEEIPQTSLTDSQIRGIQKLVANAIEKLEVQNVSVFGVNGEELSSIDDSNIGSQIDKRFQAKYEIEQRLTDKAYRLLTLVISPEKLALSVDVSLNFDQRKRMKKGFSADQNGAGVILKQRESSVEKEQDARASLNDKSTISQEKETEYLHGQETEETIYSSGEIEKIAVGVALKDALTSQQVSKIRDVLSAGLGIDTFRGDQLVVEVINISTSSGQVHDDSDILTDQLIIQNIPEKPPVVVSEILQLPNNLISTISPWWLLALFVFPTAVYVGRKRLTDVKKREAVLIELQDWLRKEEVNV